MFQLLLTAASGFAKILNKQRSENVALKTARLSHWHGEMSAELLWLEQLGTHVARVKIREPVEYKEIALFQYLFSYFPDKLYSLSPVRCVLLRQAVSSM